MKKFLSIAALGLLLLPVAAMAQPLPTPPDIAATPTAFFTSIKTIFNLLFALLLVLAVVFVLFAAFKYLTAAGDPEKVKSANHQIMYAAIAIVIALVARAVPGLVCQFLNVTCALPSGFN